ncbi:hypothetical protein [Abyssisolibacter fermentans]|uniref:hypothetical protein n=1 Tax=Abyssisolibacter fermentans TaxID=1766203 RepID=UPI00138F325F|nr:hypothetical protein [Abyssisolibacter fermentans]
MNRKTIILMIFFKPIISKILDQKGCSYDNTVKITYQINIIDFAYDRAFNCFDEL